MCTLILFDRLGSRLRVAANRDERFGRLAGPTAARSHRGVRLLAPIDLEAGGTWIGVNEHGLFVALTNRWGAPERSAARSRGALVLDALSQPNARAAIEALQDLEPRRARGFHLVAADRDQTRLLICTGAKLIARELSPGLHIITEGSFGAAPRPRDAQLRRRVQALLKQGAPSDQALFGLLTAPFPTGAGVQRRWLGYGTRSSTVISLPASAERARYLHLDRRASVEDHSAALYALMEARLAQRA